MCVCVLEILVLKFFKLKDYFERLLCWLDHWLSCMLDCIHVCVFLLSKNCFEKLARHLLDTPSIPCYLSSFSSFYLSQSWHFLDTWWINRECSCLLDSSLTPGGSIEFLFLDLIPCCSIPQLSKTIFSTPTSIASLTPLDTSPVEHYWRFYLNLLTRSISHFFNLSRSVRACSSPKHSHFTPIVFLKVSSSFFKFFYTW